MKVVQKALAGVFCTHYFQSAISNHLSIAISMSPEWMVASNRFNCNKLHKIVFEVFKHYMYLFYFIYTESFWNL